VVAILMTVDSERDLLAHGATAILSAIADVLTGINRVMKFFSKTERRIAVARGRGNHLAGVNDPWTDGPAFRNRIAQRQRNAIRAAEVSDGGETGIERFACVPCSFVGLHRHTVSHRSELAFQSGAIGSEMDMAIYQAREHKGIAQIDCRGAWTWIDEAILDGRDAAVLDQDARILARFLSRSVEQRARVHDDFDRFTRSGRGGRRSLRGQ
jgi:hypothetical protein